MLLIVLAVATLFFINYPDKARAWAGFDTTKATDLQSANKDTQISTNSKSIKINLLNKSLQPIEGIALEATRLINSESYNSIINYQPIADINDVFGIDENANLATKINLTFPDTSYLIIPDTNLIANLNADYLRGKTPGTEINNLAYFNDTGKIAGLDLNLSQYGLKSESLSQFSLTTSMQLAQIISDGTGTGGQLVFSNSPTLTTPILGDALAASVTTGLIKAGTDSTSAIMFSSVNGTPLLTLDTLNKKLIMSNATGPSFVEFHNASTGGHVSVGLLGGSPEANLSYNMDYTTRVHKYYDSTKNATWLALNANAWGIQYAPAGSTANDMWYGTGGSIPLLGLLATKQLIIGSSATEYAAGGFDGRLTVPRTADFPSITGGTSGDLIIDGHQTKGTPGIVIINNYNNGQVLLGKGGGNIGLGINGTLAAEKATLPSDGKIGWENSPGVVDTNLYRNAADTLKTDDAFVADGGITSNSFKIGNNALDASEWGNLDGLDQPLSTFSTPRFSRLGIGSTADPMISLAVSKTAQQSSIETIQKWSVSDDTNSFVQMINASASNGYFVPALFSYHASTTYPSFTMYGRASADTGTTPVQVIDSRLAASALTNRPLLAIRSYGIDKVSFGANGSATFSGAISTPSLTTSFGALGITPAAGENLNITLSATGDFVLNTDQLYADTSTGNIGIGTTAPTSKLQVVGLPVYTDNASAIAGGLTAGAFYRTGSDPDLVGVVH